MNKLYDALLIIDHLGWKEVLKKEEQKAYDVLYEKSLSLTDDELTEEEWVLIKVIDKLLKDKLEEYNSGEPSN
jgi:hypothetical protein